MEKCIGIERFVAKIYSLDMHIYKLNEERDKTAEGRERSMQEPRIERVK